MREDEENYPERMVPYSKHMAPDRKRSDSISSSGSKIARYGLKMISAIVSEDEPERWEELLRIAYQEGDERMVRYSAWRLLPRKPDKEDELIELWLAMRPERFERLKKLLLQGITEAEMTARGSRTALELAAHHHRFEIVKWLLKSNPWSEKEKQDAKDQVPGEYRNTEEWKTVWDIPFLQDGRKGNENYRYSKRSGENSFSALFQSSVVNFYSSGRYTHFFHHFCKVDSLLYNGKQGPIRIAKEGTKAFKEIFPELTVEIYGDSHICLSIV
jgi:hypothetical protein